MKLNSKYFDAIRISKPRSQAVEAQQGCDWPYCTEPGGYPAPVDPDTDQKRFFCLNHIKIYNKSYNFFEGMDQKEIQAYQSSAHTGHRPTWNMGSKRAHPAGKGDWEFQDPLEIMKTAGVQQNNNPNRRITTGQKRALEVLGLDENCAPKDVKPRYKTLLKRYHPDVNDGDRSLEEKLNKVIQAYNFLKASGFC